MKSEKGEITIQMVVTGIILIVIAGICIFMLTGENGLFVPKRQNNKAGDEEIIDQTINSDESNVTEGENEETKNESENEALVVPTK